VHVYSLEFIYIFGWVLTVTNQLNRYNTSPQPLGKILRNRNHDTIRNKFDKENKD